MRRLTAAAAFALAAAPAFADVNQVAAEGTVEVVFEKLKQEVATAGATVFAEVPHSRGAESVGMRLNDAMLLIFGSPEMGTPILQENIRAGLVLPLRMLVFADDEGQTWIAWQDVEEMLEEFDIDDDSEVVEDMTNALATFAEAAK